MPTRKDFIDALQRAQSQVPKTRRLEIRLTEEEDELFRAAASARRLTVSEWLRACGRAGAYVGRQKKGG
jgi:uncharacterized protein (DUF1778 family)